jgi:hypothetical protein
MAEDPDKLIETQDTALEKAFDRILTPFEEFIHRETTGGLLLMACTGNLKKACTTGSMTD